MDPEQRKRSSARNPWLLVGVVVLFVVAFTLLERLVGPQPPHTATDEGGAVSLRLPELRKLEDGTIEIRVNTFHRTRIRLDDEDDRQGLFDCLSQGFDQAFGDGVEGWDRERIRRETQRVQDECVNLHGPSVPVPPLPGTGVNR